MRNLWNICTFQPTVQNIKPIIFIFTSSKHLSFIISVSFFKKKKNPHQLIIFFSFSFFAAMLLQILMILTTLTPESWSTFAPNGVAQSLASHYLCPFLTFPNGSHEEYEQYVNDPKYREKLEDVVWCLPNEYVIEKPPFQQGKLTFCRKGSPFSEVSDICRGECLSPSSSPLCLRPWLDIFCLEIEMSLLWWP